MGVMPVGKLLVTMSVPAIFSMIIQALYNVVDTIFVAMTGEKGITALTLVFPVQMLMISVSVGTGIGVNSLISRRLGAKRFEEANRAACNGHALSLFNWIFFAIIGLFFSDPFIRIFTEDTDIYNQGTVYMTIVSIGSVFLMMQISAEKILQATGTMVLPMCSTVLGALVNILLDPILIFGWGNIPPMGIKGAAIATVIGQCAGMILSSILMYKKNEIIKVKVRTKLYKKTIKEIYGVALPAILVQSICSIMQFSMNFILSTFSSTAIALMGIYGRLQLLVFMPVFGINQGAMPVMGYNYGARNPARLIKAFTIAFYMALSIMAIGFLAFQLFPIRLLSMFNASDAMMDMGVSGLRIMGLCFFPAAFGIVASGLFNATGHGFISMWGTLIREILGILPLAWFLANLGGVSLVWWAFPIAEFMGFVYMSLMLKRVYNKEILPINQ